MHAGYCNVKTFESNCDNRKFKKPTANETSGEGGESICVIIKSSLLTLKFSSFLIFLNY